MNDPYKILAEMVRDINKLNKRVAALENRTTTPAISSALGKHIAQQLKKQLKHKNRS
jgi:hypothetical protein